MALEVGQDHGEVVVEPVLTHEVLLEVASVAHGQGDFALTVHDVDLGDGCEAMLLGGLHVVGDVAAASLVGGVTLHDGGLGAADELLDDVYAEVVGVAGLAGGELGADAAVDGTAQCLVDLDEVLGGYAGAEIYYRRFLLFHA